MLFFDGRLLGLRAWGLGLFHLCGFGAVEAVFAGLSWGGGVGGVGGERVVVGRDFGAL